MLVGPPVVALSCVALLAGFLLLLADLLGGLLVPPFAAVTRLSLAGCGWLVKAADAAPGGWVYAAGPSSAWINDSRGCFYGTTDAGANWLLLRC